MSFILCIVSERTNIPKFVKPLTKSKFQQISQLPSYWSGM